VPPQWGEPRPADPADEQSGRSRGLPPVGGYPAFAADDDRYGYDEGYPPVSGHQPGYDDADNDWSADYRPPGPAAYPPPAAPYGAGQPGYAGPGDGPAGADAQYGYHRAEHRADEPAADNPGAGYRPAYGPGPVPYPARDNPPTGSGYPPTGPPAGPPAGRAPYGVAGTGDRGQVGPDGARPATPGGYPDRDTPYADGQDHRAGQHRQDDPGPPPPNGYDHRAEQNRPGRAGPPYANGYDHRAEQGRPTGPGGYPGPDQPYLNGYDGRGDPGGYPQRGGTPYVSGIGHRPYEPAEDGPGVGYPPAGGLLAGPAGDSRRPPANGHDHRAEQNRDGRPDGYRDTPANGHDHRAEQNRDGRADGYRDTPVNGYDHRAGSGPGGRPGGPPGRDTPPVNGYDHRAEQSRGGRPDGYRDTPVNGYDHRAEPGPGGRPGGAVTPYANGSGPAGPGGNGSAAGFPNEAERPGGVPRSVNGSGSADVPYDVNGPGPQWYEPDQPWRTGAGPVESDSRYAGPKSTGHLVYDADAVQSYAEPPLRAVPAYPVQPDTSRSGRGPADPLAARSQAIVPAYPDAPPAPPQQPVYEPARVDEATEVLRRYVPANELLTRETEAGNTRPPTRKHPTRAIARRRARRRRALEWPFLVAFALVAAFLIRTFAIQTFYIPSGSMHETLLEGDRVLVNKVAYHLHAVHRGDVVVFRRPPDFEVDDDDLIKRVVALPGETVEGKGRKVYVNGKALTEPYVEPACNGTDDFRPTTVPAGDLWVMGDNRCDSSDSRVFGPIDQSLLVGRAFVLAWPPGRVAWL